MNVPAPATFSRRPSAVGGRREPLRHPLRAWLYFLGAVGGAVLVLVVAALSAPRVSLAPLVSYAIGFAAVCASVLASAALCPALRPRALLFALIPGAALLALWIAGPSAVPLRDAVAVTAGLLLGATLLGGVVGDAIEHPGQLLFVALVSAAADVFSVFHDAGPSHAIAQSEVALSVMALPWPMFGTPFIEPLLGAGDVVFTALYVRASRRHGLPLGRTLGALAVAYLVTMLAVIALQVTVPALPFLGLAMVLAQPAARRPAPEDRNRGLLIVAVVIAAVAFLFFF